MTQPKYTVGISLEGQTQAHVEEFFTLQCAREYIAMQKKLGTYVRWLCNVNTGREHKY